MNVDFDDSMSMSDESDNEIFYNCDEKYVFVDVQGFKSHNSRFICKEFCLIDKDYIFHAIIKSPYKFEMLSSNYRHQAQWLTKNYHGLSFDGGDVQIIEMKQKIFPKVQNKTIVVKGDEKVAWLQHLFRDCGEINCINFEDMNINHLIAYDSSDICENHRINLTQKRYECARVNAKALQNALV